MINGTIPMINGTSFFFYNFQKKCSVDHFMFRWSTHFQKWWVDELMNGCTISLSSWNFHVTTELSSIVNNLLLLFFTVSWKYQKQLGLILCGNISFVMMQKACEATSQASSKPIISFFLAFIFFAAAIWYSSHVNSADRSINDCPAVRALNAFISMVCNFVLS